jgi:hypothetical protein
MGSFWAIGIERNLSSKDGDGAETTTGGRTRGTTGGRTGRGGVGRARTGGEGNISGRAGITMRPVSWHMIFGMKSKLNTVFGDGTNV